MPDAARVLSIDALAELRDGLHRFAEKAGRALEGAHNEVGRAVNAVEQRLEYWQQETRRREEEVRRAKSELATRRWGHRDGGGPGTTDQEIALARAQRRLQEAEEKVKAARRWLRQLPQDISEFEGPANALESFLEHEMKRAVVLLQTKIEALEAYTRLAAPATPAAAAPPDGGPAA
jgi:DNA repair exonuclease SbcCD ATPase subunit